MGTRTLPLMTMKGGMTRRTTRVSRRSLKRRALGSSTRGGSCEPYLGSEVTRRTWSSKGQTRITASSFK